MNVEAEREQCLLDLKEQFPLFEKHGRILTTISKDIDDDLPEMRARVGEGMSYETPINNLYNVGDGCGPYGYSGSNCASGSAKRAVEDICKSIKPGKA